MSDWKEKAKQKLIDQGIKACTKKVEDLPLSPTEKGKAFNACLVDWLASGEKSANQGNDAFEACMKGVAYAPDPETAKEFAHWCLQQTQEPSHPQTYFQTDDNPMLLSPEEYSPLYWRTSESVPLATKVIVNKKRISEVFKIINLIDTSYEFKDSFEQVETWVQDAGIYLKTVLNRGDGWVLASLSMPITEKDKFIKEGKAIITGVFLRPILVQGDGCEIERKDLQLEFKIILKKDKSSVFLYDKLFELVWGTGKKWLILHCNVFPDSYLNMYFARDKIPKEILDALQKSIRVPVAVEQKPFDLEKLEREWQKPSPQALIPERKKVPPIKTKTLPPRETPIIKTKTPPPRETPIIKKKTPHYE